MQPTRPVNLNLFTIKFPLPAITSILHRISGVILFLLIPFMLWALQYSLTDEGFDTFQQWFNRSLVKIFIWLCLIPFCYHFVAGIRHLLMDIHIGTRLQSARLSALLTLIFTAFLVILAGIWIW